MNQPAMVFAMAAGIIRKGLQMHKEIIESLQILEQCALDEVVKAESTADRAYFLGRAIGFRLAVRVINSEEKL